MLRKAGRIFKSICFILVFLLTGISVFFASTSFAAYVSSFNENANASIAKPIVRVQNGALNRTDEFGVEYNYDISGFADGTIEFHDLRPNDRIDYFFSINNYFNEGGNTYVNEVKMKVTLVIRIFLKRLTESGDIDMYFVVGNTFLIGSDHDDQVDMDGSNFSFYKSIDGSLSTDIGSYKNITIDKVNDKISSENQLTSAELFEDFYISSNVIKYSGNATDGYSHYAGLIFDAGLEPTQQAYLLRVTLPMQDEAGTNYVSSRLFMNVNVKCEQMQ